MLLLVIVVLALVIQGAAAWSSIARTSSTQTRRLRILLPNIVGQSPRVGFRESSANTRLKMVAGASGGGAVPLLDKWKVLKNGSLVGTVSNHPFIDDGDLITTSRLKSPEKAMFNAIVITETGSKYKLGKPMVDQQQPATSTAKRNGVTPPAAVVAASKQPPIFPMFGQDASVKEYQRIKKQFELTGEKIGQMGNMYLLAGKLRRSTSGKSEIWTAYRADDKGQVPIPGEPAVTVKISKNALALEREASNYRKATTGLIRGNFVRLYDYFPEAAPAGSKYATQSALVIERGGQDLKAFLNQNGALEGKELRDAAATAAQCLQGLHSANLVWTDLKTENFVVCASGEIKGIDLESAMPHRGNPVDYSPEACPPEFAEAFLDGEGPWFQLEYSYDVWSFGMLLYEIAVGRGHFDGKVPALITKKLKNRDEIPVPEIKDEKLKDLILQCLQFEPKDRPSLAQILLHPYFLSTGIGRFTF